MVVYESPWKALERVADRVYSGKSVFFIGAGFSLDSEPNFASYLMLRLLLRLRAMLEVYDELPVSKEAGRKSASQYANILLKMFSFYGPGSCFESLTVPEFTNKAAEDYYPFNEQVCNFYHELILVFGALSPADRDACIAKIEVKETELGEIVKKQLRHPHSLNAFPAELLFDEGLKQKGKFLFVETLGLRCSRTMCGLPLADCYQEAMRSYGHVLLPRHVVLARFAMERFCPVLLTTNYDLLLEGALRKLGFHFENGAGAAELGSVGRRAYRIASPEEFIRWGHGQLDHLLVKIHGCAGKLRDCKSAAELEAYLPSMVYTYREIQNWRKDSWAREFLHTLIRTRTTIFAGYGLADQVIHDSFRSVYEEMAELRRRSGGKRSSGSGSRVEDEEGVKTPAFFFDAQESPKFHGLEMVRSASRVHSDAIPDAANHPNYIRYPRKGPRNFPDLDELFLYIHHLVVRKQQIFLLSTYLSETMAPRLRHAVREEEHVRLCGHLRGVLEQERRLVEGLPLKPRSRASLERICGWSFAFFPMILRYLRECEGHLLAPNSGLGVMPKQPNPPVIAACDHPQLAVLAVLIELALRFLAEKLCAGSDSLRLRPLDEDQGLLLEGEAKLRGVGGSGGLSLWLVFYERTRQSPAARNRVQLKFCNPHWLDFEFRDAFLRLDLWKAAQDRKNCFDSLIQQIRALEGP